MDDTEAQSVPVYRWFIPAPAQGAAPSCELTTFAFKPRKDEIDGLSFQRRPLSDVLAERPADGVARLTCPAIQEAYAENGIPEPFLETGDTTHVLTKLIPGKPWRRIAMALVVRSVVERLPSA